MKDLFRYANTKRLKDLAQDGRIDGLKRDAIVKVVEQAFWNYAPKRLKV